MTHVTIVIGRNVVLVFAWSTTTIVAIDTSSRDTVVIKLGTGKGFGVMTQSAIVIRAYWYMGLACPRQSISRARSLISVMARITTHITCDVVMVKQGFCPRSTTNVTQFAIITFCTELVNWVSGRIS
jgi:hypothetical protein